MAPGSTAGHMPGEGNPADAPFYALYCLDIVARLGPCVDYAYAAAFWAYNNVVDANHDGQGDAYEPATQMVGCKVGIFGGVIDHCPEHFCGPGWVTGCAGCQSIAECTQDYDHDGDLLIDNAEYAACGFPIVRVALDAIPPPGAGRCSGASDYTPANYFPTIYATVNTALAAVFGPVSTVVTAADGTVEDATELATAVAIGSFQEIRAVYEEIDDDHDLVPNDSEIVVCLVYHDALNGVHAVC